VQNLVILAFAAQADRVLVRHGAPAVASIDRLDDQIELHEQPLPDEVVWARARERAGSLFGLPSNEVRKGANVTELAAGLKERATAVRPTCRNWQVHCARGCSDSALPWMQRRAYPRSARPRCWSGTSPLQTMRSQ